MDVRHGCIHLAIHDPYFLSCFVNDAEIEYHVPYEC